MPAMGRSDDVAGLKRGRHPNGDSFFADIQMRVRPDFPSVEQFLGAFLEAAQSSHLVILGDQRGGIEIGCGHEVAYRLFNCHTIVGESGTRVTRVGVLRVSSGIV